ncbi:MULTISPECIES: hypothetical protein [unclassified Corallococcus]|uniref:hypothetical protein n=1 Tax=unclassified Corallococcus TaxID=2685029 RepID=UPI001A907494|nr:MULTISPECIES: hypothetical protein [unclassified Corallococcus]MBN9683675.1 hypothetical protein [Corallococcus sp. NCSPR001]WAS84816.1 hypothetical protein O0N60_36820 [Corallococcus sp. NCRR]
MRRLFAGVSAVAALSLSSAAWAADTLPAPEGIQSLGASDAVAACYVDTFAWDYLSAGSCGALGSDSWRYVTFGVLGIDQSGGRYVIQFLDGTCSYAGYSPDEGYTCLQTISHYQTVSQRMQVYDTWTDQWSGILTAYASYEPLF